MKHLMSDFERGLGFSTDEAAELCFFAAENCNDLKSRFGRYIF
jgi:hypothetical protein